MKYGADENVLQPFEWPGLQPSNWGDSYWRSWTTTTVNWFKKVAGGWTWGEPGNKNILYAHDFQACGMYCSTYLQQQFTEEQQVRIDMINTVREEMRDQAGGQKKTSRIVGSLHSFHQRAFDANVDCPSRTPILLPQRWLQGFIDTLFIIYSYLI